MTIVLPAGEAPLPKDVEVWTSLENVADKCEEAGERSLSAQPAEQTISFPVREARYVKLRVLSATSESDFQMAEVRVLESARAGYVPLFTRARHVKQWKGSPRDASAIDPLARMGGCYVQGTVRRIGWRSSL